jgi:hypothetical protein
MHASLQIGLALACVHLVLVACIVGAILSGREADWPMYWSWFAVIDFPVSVLLIPVGRFATRRLPRQIVSGGASPANDIPNFVLPLGLFGILGTAWWFIVPVIIGGLL